MCRFLLAKSTVPFKPQELLEKFADMSQKSKALDGDWQGDGWGVSTKQDGDLWNVYRSLSPIWEEKKKFVDIPTTTHIMIHARSASFPTHRGILEYNQPYTQRAVSFVFNGLLKGVSFPTPMVGSIGAQRIWNLLQDSLRNALLPLALEQTVQKLRTNTKIIQALNIGVSDGSSFWFYNQFNANPEYYALHHYTDDVLSFVVSEPLEGYISAPVPAETVIELT